LRWSESWLPVELLNASLPFPLINSGNGFRQEFHYSKILTEKQIELCCFSANQYRTAYYSLRNTNIMENCCMEIQSSHRLRSFKYIIISDAPQVYLSPVNF
jgi:hypothetical protein